MGGTYSVTMGDRGRLVIPAELRVRAGLDAGTPVILVETDSGVVMMTRTQAREHLRRQLDGVELVGTLLAERAAASAAEDAA